MEWKDGKCRCKWANPNNERYIQYHDNEWGVPIYDDNKLFEMLILESFQAGLSWECILNKKDAFYKAFEHFDIDKVMNFDSNKENELLLNPDIVCNKLKIQAAINNAKIFRKIQIEFKSFANYLWSWTDNHIIYENNVTKSDLSDAISKDLKKRGMKFVGSTIIYSYLQAVGVIYSHEKGCYLGK